MAIEHVNIADPEIHEPKGASAATVGSTYIADGLGSGSWKQIIDPSGAALRTVFVADGAGGVTSQIPLRMGWWDYNDATTSGTPIVFTSAGTRFPLSNDGAGPNTNKAYKLPEVAEVWDTSLNQFNFSGLKLGDTVHLRLDTTNTTNGANDVIKTTMDLGIGGTPYTLNVGREGYRYAGTHNQVMMFSIYMGDTNTLNNPAKLYMESDTGTTNSVVVNGWFIEVMSRGNF